MKLPDLFHHAARVLYAMYAYSPFFGSIPWYIQPEDFGAPEASMTLSRGRDMPASGCASAE